MEFFGKPSYSTTRIVLFKPPQLAQKDEVPATTVSYLLSVWLKELDTTDKRWKKTLWLHFHGTKLSLVQSWMLSAMIMTAAFSSPSFADSLTELRMVSIYWSCGAAQLFFSKYTKAVRAVIARMRVLAFRMEADLHGNENILDDTSRMARQGLRCYRWMRIYSLLAPASVVVPTLLIGRPIMHIWPESDHPLHLWTYVAWVSIVTLYCGVAYFQFFSLVLGVQLGNAALYVGLNALLERPNFTTSTLQAVAKRHAHLSAVTHEVNEVLSEYLTYFLVNALFLPALAVCDLIFKGFDPLSLVNLPLVVMQFVPLCLTGQILEDNSGYKFRFKVYSMPWTERSIAFRRLCLTMMSRSMRKASVVAWGIGNLQREACFNALKNWFKYLQLMFQMNKT